MPQVGIIDTEVISLYFYQKKLCLEGKEIRPTEH